MSFTSKFRSAKVFALYSRLLLNKTLMSDPVDPNISQNLTTQSVVENISTDKTTLDDNGDVRSIESGVSIKSTHAISEMTKEDLDNETNNQLPTEQELKPNLQKFMSACQQGNIHVVRDLIDNKLVDVNETFSDNITGLHWAAINNRLELAKYLVDQPKVKANINAFGGEINATPLHWACRSGLVYMVDYLIKNGADPTLKDSQQYNALHLAVHSSNIMLVVYLLYKFCGSTTTNGLSLYVDEPDDSNRTSLHWACYQGDILTVQALLKFGADVTKSDNTLFTPLHWSFMKAHKPLLKLLVKHDSDIFVKNDQGKDSFEIAKDMNCDKLWYQVLNESHRYEDSGWQVKPGFLSPNASKIITFLTPYVVLPMIFNFNNFANGYFLPKLFVTGLCLIPINFLLRNFVVKNYVPDRSLLKTPIAAGIFSGTLFWVALAFTTHVLPVTIFKGFFLFWGNLLLFSLIVAITFFYYKSMTLNPGLVPVPTDHAKINVQIDELVSKGTFTAETFCVHSLVRKPLRSKYSHNRKRLVARFDHYCPWVYNDVGVRNHKVFMAFTYSLNIGVFIFAGLMIAFFKYQKLGGLSSSGYDSDSDDEGEGECLLFSGSLCRGYKNNNFLFNLLFWSLIQAIWLTLLSITQTFQIVKGLTTFEFSKLMEPLRSGNGNPLCKLLGIDQFIITAKISILSLLRRNTDHLQISTFEVPTDYGIKQNWLDFWVLGDLDYRNVFLLPLNGENNLNGHLVDYYTLYEFPAKSADAIV